MEIGGFYTIGKHKVYGDRSWIGHLWVLIAENEHAAVFESAERKAKSRDSWLSKRHILDKSEFDFTLCSDEFVAAVTEEPDAE